MNVTELIRTTRDVLGENQTQSQEWTDDELLRRINDGMDKIWSKATATDESWGIQSVLLSALSPQITAVGSNRWQVVLNRDLGTVVRIEDESLPGVAPYPIPSMNIHSGDEIADAFPWSASRSLTWFNGANGRVLLFATPSSSFSITGLRAWFLRQHPPLARFQVLSADHGSGQIKTVPAQTTLGTLVLENGFYDDCFVQCTVCSAGTPQGLMFHVTSSVMTTYPTMTLNLSAAQGTPGVTTTWEIVPYWQREHHPLISYMGAYLALSKGNDSPGRQAVGALVQEMMQCFNERIEQRQHQTPRMIHFRGD